MKKLKTDYLDLMLLHQPFSDYYGAWRALGDLYEEGKLRAIGISNFYPDRMVDIASFARIRPMVNQVENHPYHQQVTAKTTAQVMLRWNIQRGVVVIPKSTHYERMEENLNVFDFSLDEEDMSRIAAVDKKGKRILLAL